MARISRSTLAMAWSWAALRRDRKMLVVAINASLVVGRSSFAVGRSLFALLSLDLLFAQPYPQLRGCGLNASWSANFAFSCAGKPDRCYDRRQWIDISEALSTHRGTRSAG